MILTLCDWLNNYECFSVQFYGSRALSIDVIDSHGPSNETCCQFQPKKTKVRLISLLYSNKRRFTRPSLLTRKNTLVLKVGVSYR